MACNVTDQQSINVLCRIVVPVTERHDKACTLQAYMKLPVSQYVLIDVSFGFPRPQEFYEIV